MPETRTMRVAPEKAAVGVPTALTWGLAFWCGASGLIYEIVCMRYLALVYGVSAYAVAMVLACFMLGLAAGNWDVGRRLDRRTPARRMLMLLQGVFAAYIAVSPWLYGVLAVGGGLFVRSLLVLAVLFVPTYCYGGTFPALVRWSAAGRPLSQGAVAWVYGLNTLGGVAGALVAGLALIRFVGMRNATWVAAGMSLMAAAVFFFYGRGRDAAAEGPPAAEESASKNAEVPQGAIRIALLACGVSGFTGLLYQVLWTRVLTLFFRDTIYDFTIVLAVFLAGIVIGSLACQRWLRQPATAARALGWVQIGIAAAVLLGLHLIAQLPWLLNDLQTNRGVVEKYGEHYWVAALAIRTGYAVLVMLPAACLFGAAFPMAARVWTAAGGAWGGGGANRIGALSGVNALGAAAGAIVAGFVLVGLLGIQHSLMAAAVINAGAGLVMLLALRPARRGPLVALVAAVVLALVILAPAWDRVRMSTGFLDQNQPLDRLLAMKFYQEDATGITSVVELLPTSQKYLVTNRLYGQNTSDLGGMQDHRRLGLIPMLLHPKPERVLAVGLGAGITLRGMVDLDPAAADVVEIAPGVVKAAAEFLPENGSVLQKPSVHVTVQDGRTFLSSTSARYDVIVLDILHPMSSGSSSMFSREYYDLCRSRLAAGGLVCQWLPVHQLSHDGVATIIRTFQASFPHTSGWFGLVGGSTQVIGLVGTNEPQAIDAARLKQRYAAAGESLAEELRQVNLGNPALFLSHYLTGGDGLAAFCSGAALDTDDRPRIEFEAPQLAVPADRQGRLNMVALGERTEPLAGKLRNGDAVDAAAIARYVAGKQAILGGFRMDLEGQDKRAFLEAALRSDPGNEDITEAVQAVSR